MRSQRRFKKPRKTTTTTPVTTTPTHATPAPAKTRRSAKSRVAGPITPPRQLEPTATSTNDTGLIIETTSGKIRGLRLSTPTAIRTWRGVPYGADTSGDHRFRVPKPVPPWAGIRDCREYGTVAAQPSFGPSEKIKGSEDCLTLDIVRPEHDAKLPVVVYIHGGSFIYGSSHQQVLRGHYLVEAMNVVYVSLNFRLGVLGYLDFSHFGDDCSPNPAVRDQLLALRWIHNNIEQFGGDPTNITLMGESAGGASVITLMCIKATQGLFHRAIAQSPPIAAVHSKAQAAFWARELASRAGVEAPTLAKLRSVSTEVLINAGQSMMWRSGELLNLNPCFGATVDKKVIHDHPLSTFRAGEQHKIPLMIGTNVDEVSFAKTFYLRSKARSKAARRMLEGYDPEGAEVIMRHYNDGYLRKDFAQLLADGIFWAPSVITASAHSLSAPTWMYRFDFAPAALRWLGLGAAHTAELSPIFGDLNGSKAATLNRLGGWHELHDLRDHMQNHWANFIHTGNPNGAETETWPQYQAPSDNRPGRATKVFDSTPHIVYDPYAARRIAWENYNMLEWGSDRLENLAQLVDLPEE
ncbi:carboxylesterase/lipase family protein [Corynebacterium mustelae]|uniref:carboxylesterase/lipase family protein n=1 Tax=Corynebacterium mustelae TaxID=571915 RepID=UPI000A015BFA|nr:carboxylesterase/lipase family protein [Corynebacterium mustelae]